MNNGSPREYEHYTPGVIVYAVGSIIPLKREHIQGRNWRSQAKLETRRLKLRRTVGASLKSFARAAASDREHPDYLAASGWLRRKGMNP